MLDLRPFKSKAPGLNDLLDWAAVIDDGLVQNKSGLLLAGWWYAPPDVASSTADERNALCVRINAALARLGSGWCYWIDLNRIDAAGYPPPEASHFPDPVSRMIDDERPSLAQDSEIAVGMNERFDIASCEIAEDGHQCRLSAALRNPIVRATMRDRQSSCCCQRS